jgi:hypothetical protein
MLLERDPVWTEKLLLKLVTVLYSHRLRGLLELLPEDMAEILGEQRDDEVTSFSAN